MTTPTAQEIYDRACALGLRLEPRGDRLAVIPGELVPPDFAAVLREHKPALLEWLSRPPCPGWQAVPPDNLPLDRCAPCPTPTERGRVIGFLLRQTGDKPGPLAAWLVRRECAYYDGPGRKWDCALFSYAVARDGACWQMDCTEQELIERLETFDILSNRNTV